MTSRANPDRDYSRVIRFCMDLQGVLKAVEMYTAEHLASVDAAVRCLNSLRTLFQKNSNLKISPTTTSLQIGSTLIPENVIERTPAFQRIFKVFSNRGITLISIRPDVAADDILSMAHTLTVPYSPSAAERQYDELENKTRLRIRVVGLETSKQDTGQHLLPHIISGNVETKLSEASKEMLYLEITRNVEDTGRLLMKQLKRETAPDAKVCSRDVLTKQCDRWIHILGELLELIHSGQDTVSAERQKQVLEMLIPFAYTIPAQDRSEEFDTFLKKIEKGNQHTKISLFAEYYEKIFQKVTTLSTYTYRVEEFLSKLEIDKTNQLKPENINSLKDILESLCPGTINFPLLHNKLFHCVFGTDQPELMLTAIIQTVKGYLQKSNVQEKSIVFLMEKNRSFCQQHDDFCQRSILETVKILSKSSESEHPERLIKIPVEAVNHLCIKCEYLKDCKLLRILAGFISDKTVPEKLKTSFVDIWQQLSHSLLHQDFNAFRTQIAPLAENMLAPGKFNENGLQDYVADAWKSFAEAEYFKNIFKRLTSPSRETRFSTIDNLSHYGAFAVWLSLGGLNSDNWQLRRNLATIISRVASLNKPVFLKQVLRDRDWHVRFEVISALRRRVEEVSDQISEETNHPLGRLITLALLDGRKEIREETYSILENLSPPTAIKSLISTYKRLAAVSDDYEIQERIRIISLLARLGQLEEAATGDVIDFVSSIAGMKERLLTPQWMIPFKKAAVECLAELNTPESLEWIETLAHKRPYKRGIVGREARTMLKKLAKQ
ncbi:hypothetical protein K8T06_09800 [bacterium]|nr:hypothetical protein [bacterium]